MVGEVCTAVDAAVSAVTGGKVSLEGFGARHGEHRRAWCTLHEGAAGPRRLARETTQHTREGRGGAWGGTHTCGEQQAFTCVLFNTQHSSCRACTHMRREIKKLN